MGVLIINKLEKVQQKNSNKYFRLLLFSRIYILHRILARAQKVKKDQMPNDQIPNYAVHSHTQYISIRSTS